MSRNSVQWQPLWFKRTDGPTHMTKVLALFATTRTGLNILRYPFSWLRF